MTKPGEIVKVRAVYQKINVDPHRNPFVLYWWQLQPQTAESKIVELPRAMPFTEMEKLAREVAPRGHYFLRLEDDKGEVLSAELLAQTPSQRIAAARRAERERLLGLMKIVAEKGWLREGKPVKSFALNGTRLKSSAWYLTTKLGEGCDYETHCVDCQPNGDCDPCFTIDGRFVEAVSDYASTCDGCSELTSHDQMLMDKKTQFGYCPGCILKLPLEIKKRLQFATEKDKLKALAA